MNVDTAPPHATDLVRTAGSTKVERTGLLARLTASRAKKCVVVQGPAGSGKTSLLESWRLQLVGSSTRVAWVDLSAGGAERSFSIRTAHAVGDCLPEACVQAGLIAARPRSPVHDGHVLKALLAGLAGHDGRIVLVLDFGPAQPGAEALQALQFVLDEGPANLLTVIAARRPLALALERLRAHGELLELGFEALRFSVEESRRYLASDGTETADLRAMVAQAQGWPMALRLMSAAARSRGHAGADGTPRLPALAHFLDTEVLGSLTNREREILEVASVPARVCPALLVDMVVPPLPLHEAIVLIECLEADGLLGPVAGATAEWRQVQPLVRAALLRHVAARPPNVRRRLHQAARDWFDRNGNAVGAVHHASAAGRLQDAGRLAERWLPRLFAQGRLWDLVRILRALPVELRSRPALRLWHAWSQLLQREFEACRHTLDLLRQDLGSPRDACHVTLLRALLAMLCDDTRLTIELLPELEAPPPDVDAYALAARRNVLTWAYLCRGEHERARQVQAEGPMLVEGRALPGTPFGTLAGNCLVGLSHAVEGRVLLAERIYREVLYQAERRGPEAADPAYTAAALLSEVLYELDDVSGAAQLLEGRRDVLDRVAMPDTVLRVMLVLARTRWQCGRADDACAALHDLMRYARERALPRLLAYGALELLTFHLRRGELAAALACQDQLRLLAPAPDEAIGAWNVDRLLAAERAHILVARNEGRLRDALQACDALIEVCRAHGRQRRAAALAVQAAAIERASGHGARSVERLRLALRTGRALGLVRSLLDADPATASLLQEAIDNGAFDAVDTIDARRVCAAAHGMPPRPAPVDAVSAGSCRGLLNDRERDVARLLAQAMSNKEIARTLGMSPETVKWRLKNMYSKLGVRSRLDVVSRLQHSPSDPR